MTETRLGEFQDAIDGWKKALWKSSDKPTTFLQAAHGIVGLIEQGFSRALAVDELNDMLIGHGLESRSDLYNGMLAELDQLDRIVPEVHINGSKPASAPPPQSPRRATPYTAPDEDKIPPRQWLYGKHYMRGVVTATVAPGGFGKTTLSLFEAITMAVDGKRVWYISAEDDRDEIDRRIAAHCRRHTVKHAVLSGWLFIDDKRSFPLKLGKMNRNVVELDLTALTALEQAIKADSIDVVIFDPFISFHYLEENNTAAMDTLIKQLADIAVRCMCNIELSHHVRKPGIGQIEITVYDARGAGAIVNAVRSCRVLNQMGRDAAEAAGIDPEERRSFVRIDSGKRNMAPDENAKWMRLVNMELANGDHVQALEHYDYSPAATTDDDRSWLRVVLKQPQRASEKAPDWFGKMVAGKFGKDLAKKGERIWVKKTIERWESQDGLIKQVELPDEHRKPRPCYVLTDKAHEGSKVDQTAVSEEVDRLFTPSE